MIVLGLAAVGGLVDEGRVVGILEVEIEQLADFAVGCRIARDDFIIADDAAFEKAVVQLAGRVGKIEGRKPATVPMSKILTVPEVTAISCF